MSYKQLMNIYSYVCSRKGDGVTISALMEKYKLKKKDIVKFLSILQDYNENVTFYYYSPKDDEFIDDFKAIDDGTIIQVNDDFKNLKLKLDFEDSIRLYEIVEEWINNQGTKDRLLTSMGRIDTESFSYIIKGLPKYDLNAKIAKRKNKLIECILNEMTIIIFFNGEELKANPLGIRYNRVRDTFILIASCDGDIKEYDIEHIENIRYAGEYFSSDFNVEQYLNATKKNKLKLQVYHEANVLEKIKGIFNDTEVFIEDRGTYSILEAKVQNPDEFKGIIDSFGMSVIVLEPESLRKSIIDGTLRLLERYENR